MGTPFHEEPSYGSRDPIAAPATPLGESALALIRTSGGGIIDGTIHQDPPEQKQAGSKPPSEEDDFPETSAIDLLARVFSRSRKLVSVPGNTVIHGWITEPGTTPVKKIDEVLISVYRAPKSYTGEDGADISCHGGTASVNAVMAALKKAGFREALPGEFTFRAFMNGKLDLTRAESVMELVSARTHRGREQALRRLAGVLSEEISVIKAMLVEVLTGTEIYLDYSEDEFLGSQNDEEAGRLPERALAERAAEKLKVLADLWRRERIYADGALAVIAGRPNAGKSSLFNYLCREDRSIVTDVPGTTRDWIEAQISLEGIPLRLADTAGIRGFGSKSENGETCDEAEQIGIERSLELLDRSDLVLYVIDGVVGITEEDREFLSGQKNSAPEKHILVIWNKADLVQPPPFKESEIQDRLLSVSAKTGEGVRSLLDSIPGLLEKKSLSGDSSGASDENSAGPGSVRQKELIDTALASVEEALTLADNDEPLDIIAPLFRSAINALGEITGEVTNGDILETMFSRFCVGK